MASRLARVGLAAAVTASSLTGCVSSRQYQASKEEADKMVAHYIAHLESHTPKYVTPNPKSTDTQTTYPSSELLERINNQNEKDAGGFTYYMEESRNIKERITQDDIYDACTGECLIGRPSEGEIINYVFYKFTNGLDRNHPIRRLHEGARRFTGNITGWVKEVTGAEKVDTYGIGILFKFNY